MSKIGDRIRAIIAPKPKPGAGSSSDPLGQVYVKPSEVPSKPTPGVTYTVVSGSVTPSPGGGGGGSSGGGGGGSSGGGGGGIQQALVETGGGTITKTESTTPIPIPTPSKYESAKDNLRKTTTSVVDKIKDLKIGEKYVIPRPLEPVREQVKEFKQSEIDLTQKEADVLRREADLKITEEELEKETRELTVYLGDKVEGDVFTGTEEEYKVYQDKLKEVQKQEQLYFKEFKDYEKSFGEYEGAFEKREGLSTIKVGLIGGGRDRSILEFSKVEDRPATTAFKYLGATLGETAGVGTEKTFNALGIKEIKTTDYGKQLFLLSPVAPLVVEQGVKRGLIPDTLTPEQAGKISGKITETGIGVGKYFVPTVGGAVFATEVAEFGREAVRTKRDTGQLTPELKREGAVLGGVILTAGVLKGVQAFKGAKSASISKSITKEIGKADKEVLRTFTNIKGRKVVGTGFARTGTTVKRIEYVAETQKVIGSKAKILSGQGTLSYEGVARPDKVWGFIPIKARQFTTGVGFEIGSKGGSKFIKTLSEGGKLYTTFGTSTIIPRVTGTGVAKVGASKMSISIDPAVRTVIKDVRFPVIKMVGGKPQAVSGDFLYTKGNNALRFSKDEAGFIITQKTKRIPDSIGFKGGGQKSSQEFFDSLYKVVQETKPNVVKSSVTKTSKLILKKDLKVKTNKITEVTEQAGSISLSGISTGLEKSLPTLTSATTTVRVTTPSAYAGTGLYERTESSPTFAMLEKRTQLTIQPPMEVLKPKEETLITPSIKPSGRVRDSLIQQPIEKVIPIEQQVPIQEQILKQQVKQVPRTILQPPRVPRPPRPSTPTPKVPFKLPTKPTMVGFKTQSPTSFEVFQRIAGKDVKTGEFKELTKATRGLKKGLASGLQASGFIIKKDTGEKVKAEELLGTLGDKFRPGISDPFKVVEKTSARLRKGTTGKEIQAFRRTTTKNKKGSKNLFGL